MNKIWINIFIIVAASIFAFPQMTFALGLLPGETIISLTNEFRIEEGLSSLDKSELLSQAAQLKAEDMAELGYFSHVGPDGKEPVDWLADVEYSYWFTGENIAAGTAG